MVARLYSRVVITNWSDAALRFKRADTSGEWTPGGWSPDLSPVVAPGGAQASWQGEGDTAAGAVPFNGVETHVYYDVVVGERVIGEFAVHTNNPLVESQYGVKYHVNAPPGYYASYVDAEGQSHGGRAILEINFRKTRRIAVAGFSRMRTLGRRYGLAPDIVDAITGHTRRTVTDSYGEFPMSALYRELAKISVVAM
jgi:hypothetical protein